MKKKELNGQFNSLYFPNHLDSFTFSKHLFYALVPTQFIQSHPYLLSLPFLDCQIAFFFQDFLQNPNELLWLKQTDLDNWNMTLSEIFSFASVNTQKTCPHFLSKLQDFLHPFVDKATNCIQEHSYLLSNYRYYYGATSLLYPNVLLSLQKIYQSVLWIIPSSVHEVLIMPESDHQTFLFYQDLLRQMNQKTLLSNERLSYSLFQYDFNHFSVMT